MGKHKIYFRADGSRQIGLGHISRCSALAQMLNDTFECVIVTRTTTPELKMEMLKNFSDVIELNDSLDISTEATRFAEMISDKDIVVLDGYEYTTAYQQIIKEKCCLLVCVDDIFTSHFVADAVINHAGGISAEKYSKEFYTQLYLGPEYALLRKPFYPQRILQGKHVDPDNVLIVMGGADPCNETKKILTQCFSAKPERHYHVITGAAYSHMNDLEKFLEENKNHRTSIYKNISAEEIAVLMESCPVAITAPSTVAMEYLYVGGRLFLQQIADNQTNIYRYLLENKLAYPFSDFISQDRSHDATKVVRLSYDFVQNLKKIFSSLSLENNLKIKKVSLADRKQIFDWINDPAVRQQSFSSDPISWETHIAWFDKKLNDAGCFMYLFYFDEHPAGQIRFDIDNGNAIISYLIDKDQRGKGLGNVILKKGILALLADNNTVGKVTGFVKKENVASCKSFRKMSFAEEETDEYPGSFKYTLSI